MIEIGSHGKTMSYMLEVNVNMQTRLSDVRKRPWDSDACFSGL